ncbi:conserved Plasmodium protein, unknown function [Plasmodium ovale]|uniref:Uncharacterized protein n=2 Tax=Plasmodium ovale TaxID=36330 RepID=A0A1A8WME2_PLAOA|nr:conserved Plasmodium protein, unknown function [Plasmodium ovale curtisi]SCP04809.1 conserved Plasmodium protein, unknown function [Plasmodium ovale]
MKIILKKTIYYLIFNFICIFYKVDNIRENNKTNLFLFPKTNFINKKRKVRSTIHNSNRGNTSDHGDRGDYGNHINRSDSDFGACLSTSECSAESEEEIRKRIEEEKARREKVKQENNLCINANFRYVSNNIPINVEKKYTYETFKYSHELLAYIFYIVNLFKHEQFKNCIYKKFSKKVFSQRERNESSSNELSLFCKNNTLLERNQMLVKNFINKFGDKFKFFNTHEKIQREDWANMFKIEQDDKNDFFKNIKIKSEITKEYYFVIYYCNWKYECMALYNAFHNIFHNFYNDVNFFNIENKVYNKNDYEDEKEEEAERDKKKKKDEKILKENIEKIKEMYIKDMQNGRITDIDTLLSREENAELPGEADTIQEKEPPSDKKEEDENVADKQTEGNTADGDKKKTFLELMEEEKKKLDEEFFLYGYSKYEDEEQIKKEEEMIRETKKIIKEEKLSKGKLNNERDFKNILNDFPFHIKNYKDFYHYDDSNAEKGILTSDLRVPASSPEEKKLTSESVILPNDCTISQAAEEIKKKSPKEVNINVIFVRLSNSTVIGKTKNIKEKIKKKWIYSHEKEIKFYELILSVMLNENIYYKDIPHMDIFSLSYDKRKLYNYFNQVNTNLKHSFIHRNNVYDIFNNVINDQMDIYNFDVYDQSRAAYNESTMESDSAESLPMHSNPLGDETNGRNMQNGENLQNEDVVFEELSLDHEVDDMENYQVIYDGNENGANRTDEQFASSAEDLGERKKDVNSLRKIPTKKGKKNNVQNNIIKKKHNKKEKSKYEVLFKQKYTNIASNNIINNVSIEKITSISNAHTHANYTVDTFSDFPLNQIFQNTLTHQNFKVDENYVYYLNYKIPKEIFPFILQLSLAFKYEHTTILMNAPKKIAFEFRNV